MSSAELLGEVVAWDLGGVKEVRLSSVRDAIDQAGIRCDVPELRATTAFSRAAKPLKKEHVIRAKKKGPKGDKQYEIHRVEETDEIDYYRRAGVKLNGGRAVSDDYDLERELNAGMSEALETRTQGDITKIVQGLFDNQAEIYPLVPSKGVAYIVPVAYRDFVAQIEQFVNALGGRLSRVPIPKGDEVGNRNFAEAVEMGLDAMIAEVASVSEKWTDKTRESTVEKHLAKLDQVIFRAECYAEHLGAQQSRLLDAVKKQREECQARLAALMTVDESDDEPTEEPTIEPVPTDQIKRARIEGWDACEASEGQDSNPYTEPLLAEAWRLGYKACLETEDADEPVEVV